MTKKDRIVSAFLELLKDGSDISKISIQMIATKANIGKGTVYEYFDSKDEIILYSIEYSLDYIAKEHQKISTGNLNYIDSLNSYANQLYDTSKKVKKECGFDEFKLSDFTDNKDFHSVVEKKIKDLMIMLFMILNKEVIQKGISEEAIGNILSVNELKIVIGGISMFIHRSLKQEEGKEEVVNAIVSVLNKQLK